LEKKMTLITGNTYPVKDAIKALGGKWDADRKGWTVPDAKADAARKLVSGAPAQSSASGTGKCSKCGKSCKPEYSTCFACSGKKLTKCVNCGDPLDDYAIRRGYKRCLDCVDGGSRAHGGMSYHDRNGNFVLGDDD
jgi:hypothetical protein